MNNTRTIWLLLAAVAAGCTGVIAPDVGDDEPGTAGRRATGGRGGTAGSTSRAGAGSSGAAGDTVAPIDPTQPLACDRAASRPVAPKLKRLTRAEYVNTVADLFPGTTLPAIDLPVDQPVDGFDNNTIVQGATPDLVDGWAAAATAIAEAVDPAKVAGCDPAASGCGAKLVAGLGARAYRRPLANDEASRLQALFDAQSGKQGGAAAVRTVVQALLLAPQFLYRAELGKPDPVRPGVAALDGYELATRLSYFLWQRMPDDALFAAAKAGTLATADGVEAQVRRMLNDDRARAGVARFFDQWLRLPAIRGVTRDAKLFPAWKPDLADRLYDATTRFVARNFWEGGGVAALFAEPKAFADAVVAPVFGVAAPAGGAAMSLVDLDPTRRRGLLTQPGLLASLAHERVDAPIKRGVYLLSNVLCAPPPSPPKNVPALTDPAGDKPRTERQHVAETHSVGGCMACHAQIDGAGFLFEHYDALGQWRDQDNGLPVDATGKLSGFGALDGDYDGVLALSERLSTSDQVAACIGRQLVRLALGRTELDADACAIADAMGAAKGDLREAMVQLARSDAFRFRQTP